MEAVAAYVEDVTTHAEALVAHTEHVSIHVCAAMSHMQVVIACAEVSKFCA